MTWCASDLPPTGKDNDTGYGIEYIRTILTKDPAGMGSTPLHIAPIENRCRISQPCTIYNMPDKKSLIKKYQSKQKEQKIIELLNQGEANYVEIAREVGVSVQYVRETIKAELASASSPQEILEYREEIGSVLSAQTPRLTKRAVRQANRQERLEKAIS